MTGNEEWIYSDNSKRKNSRRANHINGHKVLLCILWDQQVVIYYELLKLNATVVGYVCRSQLNKMNDRIAVSKRSDIRCKSC